MKNITMIDDASNAYALPSRDSRTRHVPVPGERSAHRRRRPCEPIGACPCRSVARATDPRQHPIRTPMI